MVNVIIILWLVILTAAFLITSFKTLLGLISKKECKCSETEKSKPEPEVKQELITEVYNDVSTSQPLKKVSRGRKPKN